MKANQLIIPFRPVLCALIAIGGAMVHGENAAPLRQATFDVRHELKIQAPEGAQLLRVWFTMPQQDPAQRVEGFKVSAPVPHRMSTDSEGNQMVYLEMQRPQAGELSVVETFRLTRTEQRAALDPAKARPLTAEQRVRFARHLESNQHVPVNDEFRKLAGEIVGEEQNPLLAARRIYDWVLDNVEYWVKDPVNNKASPVGSAEYCLATRTGNCTDFHSLWTSLARAAGIPTRLIYGSFFKKELDGQDADQSYHCWPEFYVNGLGWIPHDVAVADIFLGNFETTPANERLVRLTTADGYAGADREKVDYYFGNVEERRVTWSQGRDLILSPRQSGGPVNAMAKAYVEVDGRELSEGAGWTRKLTYREVRP